MTPKRSAAEGVGTSPAAGAAPSAAAVETTAAAARSARYRADGLRFTRSFTKAGVDPYSVVHYERRPSVIRETDGREVFRMDGVEVPTTWSQVATDILAQKYFRKTGVPQLDENGEVQRNPDGSVVLGPERSVKQVVHRLAGCWRYWGETHGYFASAEDAQAFYDELVFALLTQRAAPNSPQWFNTGLYWAYGIAGRAQGHWYADPDTGTLAKAPNAYEHPQPHACQPYHALVSTPDGPMTIGEIVEQNGIGLEVYDRDHITRVIAVKHNGEKPVLRVVLANGNTLEATADHLVWAAPADAPPGRGEQWIGVGKLQPGMRLVQRTDIEAQEMTTAETPWLNQMMANELLPESGSVSHAQQGIQRQTATLVAERAQPTFWHVPIRRIEPLGVQPVYDIQTESGNYLSGNVVVHNCFIQAVDDDLVNEGGIMDLWVREARLFKYGSGTGTNFSSLRASGEKLSGGGKSSGLPSWLKIGDAAAAGIKSGGTTRRAAKMVILDIDHPDVEWFINWKVKEERKVAAMVTAGFDSAYEGEAYQTVSGQNSNNSVRLPNEFVKAVLNDQPWELKGRVDPSVNKTVPARELWRQIAHAAWACADPGVQFDTTINEWNTCPRSGKIRATNPCSEYVFLDDTACNLASINLAPFYDPATRAFDVPGFTHAVRLWTTVLEISVLMSASPSREIAEGTFHYRTLGLGYANLGALLMTAGIPYDSPEARGFASAATALMTGAAYRTSAELAAILGPFPKYAENREDMLRVMRNHRRAAYHANAEAYEGLTITPVGIDPSAAPADLLAAARQSWDEAYALGERHGYRNAQVTLLAPTGTIGLLMDCATTGVEPDFALVKFKKLAGGGYFKIVNEAVPTALATLGYTEPQIADLTASLRGHGTLTGSPHVNPQTLAAKGLTAAEIAKVDAALKGAFDLTFAFTPGVMADACLQRLGFTPAQYGAPGFNLLAALGFTPTQIAAANEYVCGTMTIEGAPHLKPEHEAVFDCANKCGRTGRRYIHFMGHVRMLAAVQPFLSGSISKTINMPNDATVQDVEDVYQESWKLCLKCLSIYRDGSKLSQPLSTSSQGNGNGATLAATPTVGNAETPAPAAASHAPAAPPPAEAAPAKTSGRRVFVHGEKRELPYKRSGITVEAEIAGHKVFLRTGEYPDGSLGEIFIDMYKEGAAYRSIMNSFAVAVSTALKYGVPLEKLVNKFTFTRFEPAGPTSHPNVKFCTSVLDFVFRILAMEYLGWTDLVQVPPTGIQKNRAQQLAELAVRQQRLELKTPPEAGEKPAEPPAITAASDTPAAPVQADQVNSYLGQILGDAPLCDTCGHVMVRNASCYKCLNCGSTSGCS